MTTKVYFIRHSKPDFSVKEDLIRPLSVEGIEKSKKLVKLFSEIKIDFIYSSPYKRAIQTITPIAENKDINIEIINDFRERKMSDNWIDNFDGFCKNQWNDFSYKLIDGESLLETQKRNIEELNKILLKDKGKTIIIGTHGTALSTIINYYDKTFNHENFMQIVDIMPYIIKMEFNNNEYLERDEIDTN
ncbi:MAG: phosphoglycerate mutase family protein [Treponema sp.]|jgi:2,3-bisphosphoglycerate-dependent phosphoglycerate mutase|nr:phosphoglycerate mutase family protein [Treponema sp.]